MNCYYVHYEVKWLRQHMRMIHPVEAESAEEAIKLCKTARPGSYDHQVNESRQGRGIQHRTSIRDISTCRDR